jgi:hypothetical protein
MGLSNNQFPGYGSKRESARVTNAIERTIYAVHV